MQHKSLLQKLKYPAHVFAAICRKLYFLFPNDHFYLRLIYYLEMGEKLDLKHPKAFSEKLQWLKLYDRNPEYTKMVDKVTAKEYVATKIIKSISNKLRRALKSNIYRQYREWPYKNVKPRVIAEEYLEDETGSDLKDYKVFCCNGVPKLIKVNYDVTTDYKSNWYSPSWDYVKGTTVNDPSHEEIHIKKPYLLDELLDKAKALSSNIPFLRVDFYILSSGLKFGELTFYPGSGFEKFEPKSFDEEIGAWIDCNH